MKRYVIVGFRHDKENSVYYQKWNSIDELLNSLRYAIEQKNANIISIRVVERDGLSNLVEPSSKLKIGVNDQLQYISRSSGHKKVVTVTNPSAKMQVNYRFHKLGGGD